MNSSYTDLDDAALVEAARCDAEAFDVLYGRYVQRVYRYCCARVGNRQDAEDLTTEVFLAVLESLDRYQDRSCFAAWLFGIARNICALYHRNQYTHPELMIVQEENPRLQAITGLAQEDTPSHPERVALRKERLSSMKLAIETLSQDRREALYLRFWGGLTHREIAEVMGKTAGAVKMLIWRSVNDLRRRCVDET